MQTRKIAGQDIGPIGLGCAPISVRDDPDEELGLRTMVTALDAGVTLLDTADVYNPPGRGAGHSERLIRKALKLWGGNQERVIIATKGGKYWNDRAEVVVDGRPAYLRSACEASLRRLEVETIPLYLFHEPDPSVPFAESVGALAELQREGKVKSVGVSNVTSDQLEIARRVVSVAAVQNRYSPMFVESRPQLERCTQLGIAFLPWGPLGGLRGTGSSGPVRRRFAMLAEQRGVSVARLALAWALRQSPVMVPIPGATRPESILDNVEARSIWLGDDELDWLNARDHG